MLPALEAMKEGLAGGELPPGEAAELSKLVDKWVETLRERAEAARVEAIMAPMRARYAHLGPGPQSDDAA